MRTESQISQEASRNMRAGKCRARTNEAVTTYVARHRLRRVIRLTALEARPDRELRIIDGTIWCAPPEYDYFEYWGDPEKTSAPWQVIDGKRWFTVGDLGRLDEEGYLCIEGRREDFIITGGMTDCPAELEGEILAFEGVRDAAVFGVPDERWDQRVCAAIVGDVDVNALTTKLRLDLAGYKQPKESFVVEKLRRTASGKIQRLRVAVLLELE